MADLKSSHGMRSMTDHQRNHSRDHSNPDFFLLIGVLVASWILSGTIPTIMVYGFKLVSVRFFLPTAFLVCAIVGVTVGSSFTTISTIGIAFWGSVIYLDSMMQ